MAGRVFTRRPAVRGTPKRKSLWLGLSPASTVVSGAGGTITNSLNAAALALRPFTIIRTHLEVWIRSDQDTAAEQQIAAIGLAIVSDQAVAIGVTAVPTPTTDSGSSLWFVHQWLLNSIVAGATNVETAISGTRYSVDSKAMRKVEAGSDLVMVVEDSGVEEGAILITAGRILVKTN